MYMHYVPRVCTLMLFIMVEIKNGSMMLCLICFHIRLSGHCIQVIWEKKDSLRIYWDAWIYFYPVSLLHIISNSKNVPRLQKHFKKMFAGVHTVITRLNWSASVPRKENRCVWVWLWVWVWVYCTLPQGSFVCLRVCLSVFLLWWSH